MNKKHDIESYLRNNKPQVKDNPAFLLEVQQKMNAVEGIKTVVDRQRTYGRTAMISALILGVLAGAAATLLIYLYPVNTGTVSGGITKEFQLFIETYKELFMITTAVCATALGLIFGRSKKSFS